MAITNMNQRRFSALSRRQQLCAFCGSGPFFGKKAKSIRDEERGMKIAFSANRTSILEKKNVS